METTVASGTGMHTWDRGWMRGREWMRRTEQEGQWGYGWREVEGREGKGGWNGREWNGVVVNCLLFLVKKQLIKIQ